MKKLVLSCLLGFVACAHQATPRKDLTKTDCGAYITTETVQTIGFEDAQSTFVRHDWATLASKQENLRGEEFVVCVAYVTRDRMLAISNMSDKLINATGEKLFAHITAYLEGKGFKFTDTLKQQKQGEQE